MSNMKPPNCYQSKGMTNVKVFADKQTDARTNGHAKNYTPPPPDLSIYTKQCETGTIYPAYNIYTIYLQKIQKMAS